MKVSLAVLVLVSAFTAGAQPAEPAAEKVALDAAVIDRIAEVGGRDLPKALVRKILEENIETMRGPRADGTYRYATHERFEAGRITEDASIRQSEEKMQTVEVRGAFIYRVAIEVPSRRLVVRKNRPIWIERVDLEYMGEGSAVERSSVEVKSWLEPGTIRPVDLPIIARQAVVRVIAAAGAEGYGNLLVSLIQARIVDLSTSPFAQPVAAAKSAQRALEANDLAALRSAAQRMRQGALDGRASAPLAAAPVRPAATQESSEDLVRELTAIEDLLTGTEEERRSGMDQLHQLIRKIRQRG